MKDYLVYGTKYNKFDEIFEWILNHQDAHRILSSYKLHKDGKYSYKETINLEDESDHRYFEFRETSLVYNEELMLCRNTTNYTKSIIIFRDIYDVIETLVNRTFRSVDNAVAKQVNLFEEYVEEMLKETNKIPEGYELFINYNRLCTDIGYRDKIAEALGFENTDITLKVAANITPLRNKLRYKKYITQRLTELNDIAMDDYKDNSLYM